MAYFNHAFRKTFLATGQTVSGYPVTLLDGSTVSVNTDGGFLTTTDVPTYVLNSLSQAVENGMIYGASNLQWVSGFVGLFDPKSNLSISTDAISSSCCPFYIAGSAIYSNDKIGPFHGGYTETNKSKMINPKYVSRMYTAAPCEPQNEVVHVGSTYWTAGGRPVGYGASGGPINGQTPYLVNEPITLVGGSGEGFQIVITTNGLGTVTSWNYSQSLGKGYTSGDNLTVPGDSSGFVINIFSVSDANTDPITGAGGASCCKEFLCGETYYLRVDIKGSPALRYLNHNAYYTASAYTGCCPEGAIAPVAVDSTEVMIKWADDLLRSPIVNPFMQIVIQDENGVLWYEPGTSAADLAQLGGDTWDNYVSAGHVDGACAGLIINGAYVDTKFGDCTFQLTDFYEKEPVKIYVSEVDLNGDPCTFEGICVVHECLGTQPNGLGETMVRDLQLSESYRQNFLHSDFRIREITQGNQIISAINRSGLYWGFYLQHSVPRHNNPSGTFDNDQYLLQIISTQYQNQFDVLANAISKCGMCEYENYDCITQCEVPIVFPPIPVRKR